MKYFLLFLPFLCFAKIQWEKNYDAALQKAHKQKKGIVVYFTGSDWCPWCVKFQEEILSKDPFAQALEKDFLFVCVDFPKKTLLPAVVLKQNQELKNGFDIRKFPTVLLLSSDGKVMSRMGYQPIPQKEYAAQVLEIKREYSDIVTLFEKGRKNWSESMEKVYQRAKNLGAKELVHDLLQEGLQKDEGPFFLLEYYTTLLEKPDTNPSKLLEVRKEIEDRDAQNVKGALRRLAILDFQHLADKATSKAEVQKAVEPLIKYIEAFKTQDPENIWRLEMMVSQYLFSRENIKDALKHARKSYKAAPEIMRKEIAESIIYLKEQQEKSLY